MTSCAAPYAYNKFDVMQSLTPEVPRNKPKRRPEIEKFRSKKLKNCPANWFIFYELVNCECATIAALVSNIQSTIICMMKVNRRGRTQKLDFRCCSCVSVCFGEVIEWQSYCRTPCVWAFVHNILLFCIRQNVPCVTLAYAQFFLFSSFSILFRFRSFRRIRAMQICCRLNTEYENNCTFHHHQHHDVCAMSSRRSNDPFWPTSERNTNRQVWNVLAEKWEVACHRHCHSLNISFLLILESFETLIKLWIDNKQRWLCVNMTATKRD